MYRWLSGKDSTSQCRRHWRDRFDPWVGKIPGGGNGNRSRILAWGILSTEKLGGLQPMGIQRVRHALVAELAFNVYTALYIIQSSPFKIFVRVELNCDLTRVETEI